MQKLQKPYPFQRDGAHWLASKELALLADEPGLGKTGQVIMACDLIRAQQILVIPPASVRFVWREEMNKWSAFGHDVHVMTSTAHRPQKNMVNIINYDLLSRGFEKSNFKHNEFMKELLKVHWDVIIPDEAHGLKERESLRTRAILENRGLAGRTDRLWMVTGTPMPNHPGELWTILVSLGATKLNYQEFIERYCVMGKHGYSKGKPQGMNPETSTELKQLLRGVMMRRYKKFVMPELPPIRIDDCPVPEVKIKIEEFFTESFGDPATAKRKIKEQEEFVAKVWQRAVASGGKMNTMDMVRVLESVGPGVAMYRRWLGCVKAASFMPILIDELETGALRKVVIFAHHKQVIAFLKNKLKQYNPQVIDGSVNNIGREKAVHNFQNKTECRVFIGQIIAAGTGLTLTAAHEVVVLEPDWVPSNNAQAIMRCHRIGQRNAVRARFVRLADTLDDYISDTLARKTKDIVSIIGG